MSKNHLFLYSFATIIPFFVHNGDASMPLSGKIQFPCSDSEPFYRCSDGKAHEVSKRTYQLTGETHDAAIEASGEDTIIEADSIIINGVSNINDHSGKSSWITGVKASTQGSVALYNSILNDVSIGADINEGGAFEMQDGVINATRMGISVAGKQSFVFLSNAEIKTIADAISLFSQGSAKIEMEKGKIDFTDGIGVQTAGGGKVILDGVSIIGRGRRATNTGSHSENSAFHMLQGGGSITFQKGKVHVVNSHGLSLQGNDNNTAHIENSTVMVSNQAFNGMRFFWEAAFDGGTKTVLPGRGAVHLTRTIFMVPESTAIYSRQFESSIKLSKGSTVLGDLLLRAEENSTVKVTADASVLVGGTHVDKNSTATLQLKNNSKWTLSRPKYEKLQDSAPSDSQLGDYSSISSLDLADSSLFFKELETGDTYKTLLVGKGSGKVYHAQGNVHLYLNTYLDKGGALHEQKTDRLLVHGDVEGTTIVHVQGALGSRGDYTGEHGNSNGISIIQVYGTANKDSFQLNGGYVTSQGSPYQYRLYAYGPNSSLGGADSSQRVLKGEEAFWDFRLESEVIQPTPSDYEDLLYILNFSTAPRFHVISSIADSLTETEVLNSILLSVTSDAPKVTKSGAPIVIKSDDLSSFPPSATSHDLTVTETGRPIANGSKDLSNLPLLVASDDLTVTESGAPIVNETEDLSSFPPSAASGDFTVTETDTSIVNGSKDLSDLPPLAASGYFTVTETGAPIVTETEDLSSLPSLTVSDDLTVTESYRHIVNEPEVLGSISTSRPTSAAPRSRVISSAGTADTESKVLSRFSISRPTSAAPRSRVISSAGTADTESKVLSRFSISRPTSAAPRSRVISSAGTADTESKVLSRFSASRPTSVASRSRAISSAGTADTESKVLSRFSVSRPMSVASRSRVISSAGTADTESKILSRSSDASTTSAANPTVIESVTPIATEIDASEKYSPALDDVVAASVAVAPKGDATLPDLDYVSLISKDFLASELSPHFKQNVRAVVPQIPTYIFLPNTLFHTGWMDISNQNKRLEALRTVFHQSSKIDKNPALFLRGYSGSYRYDSNLSALEYGYGGELDYNAMEVGTLLKNIESVYSTTSFGVMGTYGKLSLQPLDVEQSQKSIFDKWFVTAYGSVQYDTGFYIDSLLSYGLFSGNIFTLARSKTATLRGNPLSVSLAAGKAFRIGYENFVLDPQIQFVYQHLRFRKTHDVDGFDIDMRKPDYWMMRVGGRLTKTLAVIEKARVLSFYGQLHFIRNFDNKQFVHLGDTFLLGDFGSSLEAGFGVYAQLSSKVTFHSNLIYKHKFTKAGFSGTHFSSGLSYHF